MTTRSTTVSSTKYLLLKSYLRRQTHPIATTNATFGHKVSLWDQFCCFSFVVCSWCRLGLHPKFVRIQRQHGHVHLHRPARERCSGQCLWVIQELFFHFKPNVHPAWCSSLLFSQNLTVSEVQNLLGTNLNDLKSYENETLVQSWIRSQLQSELDGLGLGLTGGRSSPTTPSGTTVTTAAPTVTNTAPSTTTTTTTTTAVTTTGEHCKSWKYLFVHTICGSLQWACLFLCFR